MKELRIAAEDTSDYGKGRTTFKRLSSSFSRRFSSLYHRFFATAYPISL